MSATRPVLEFWYDLASTYSYLSAMRIEALAQTAGVDIQWRPFLLGPIFQEQGWSTSPFNLYPAKGRYMIRDMQRLAVERGLVFHSPVSFPANSVKAARIALVGAEEGWIAAFSQAVFVAEFAHARDIGDTTVLAQVCQSLRLDFARVSARSADPDTRQALRRETDAARQLGIFGAPTFRTASGELFWGDDRLQQALDWARKI